MRFESKINKPDLIVKCPGGGIGRRASFRC
jgi:hypothetical protein